MPLKLWDTDEVCRQIKKFLPKSMTVKDTSFWLGKKKLAWLETTAKNTSFEGFPNNFTLNLENGVNKKERFILILSLIIVKITRGIKLYYWQER